MNSIHFEEVLRNIHIELGANNTIDAQFYEQFDVKRGLRNSDGSGVLAGLTKISSVVGTKKSAYGLEPIEGVLKYRGISFADIAASCKVNERCHFERVCFLLLVGRYPQADELQSFTEYMAAHRAVPQSIIDGVIKGLPSKNIMNKLQTSMAALYGFDSDPDVLDPVENLLKTIRLVAKLPMIVAYSYLAAYEDKPKYVKPVSTMSHAESFLHMLYQGQNVDPFHAYIIDLSLVIHAEHGGGNNSTFTTYVVTSSGSDIYSTLAAAVASLKGPLHGAANKKVMEMMADIKAKVSDWSNKQEVTNYLAKLVNKTAGDLSGKLYGLGHAVYTKSDPRALAIQGVAQQIAKQQQREDEYALYNLIATLGPTIFQTEKQSSKVISPNVDFFSGFVYDCLAIPQAIYTPMFAMARAVGWSAHRLEELLSGKRIIRPGYKYVG